MCFFNPPKSPFSKGDFQSPDLRDSLQQKPLYIFILSLSALLVIVALGGGLFGQSEPWYIQWQHKLFAGLCHQLPERSFWIGEQPMAVCSRCFGIYVGFFTGLVGTPAFGKMLKKDFLKKLLLVIVLLNIVDVAGNIIGVWNNALFSRFALGFSLAFLAALLLGQAFIKQKQITLTKKSYGTNRSI